MRRLLRLFGASPLITAGGAVLFYYPPGQDGALTLGRTNYLGVAGVLGRNATTAHAYFKNPPPDNTRCKRSRR